MPTMPIAAQRLRTLKTHAADRSHVVKAMAHPTRLLVLEAMMAGEHCVNDLTAMAG